MYYVKHFDVNGVETRQVACIELHGRPNAATEGAVGVLGIDMNSPTHEMYRCVAVKGSIYTWELLTSGGGGASGTYYTVAIPSATDTDLKGWTATASGYELIIQDVAWMTEDLFIELKCENSAVFTEHSLMLHQDNGFLDFSIDSLPEKASTLYIVVPNYTNGGMLNGGDA